LDAVTDKGKAVGRLDLTFDETGNAEPKSNDIHMLLDTVPDDPQVAGIVDEFKVGLAAMDFQPHRDDEEGLTTITAARSATANRYVAEESCAQCHSQAVAAWKRSKHSHSFDSLVARQHQFNPRCLKCHTVGYGASDGYINQELTPMLDAVSCGNCHGRAGDHVKFHTGGDATESQARLISVNCVTCHDPENSPTFNREIYWEQIVHGLD
ncbi:MAG: multiheme c-type cytochrome, partial [Candidatus Hydrogenedentales bacterium]